MESSGYVLSLASSSDSTRALLFNQSGKIVVKARAKHQTTTSDDGKKVEYDAKGMN